MTEITTKYKMELVFCSCEEPSGLVPNAFGSSIRYPDGEPVFKGFACLDCGELLNDFALRPYNHLELYILKQEVEKLSSRLKLAIPF